MEETAISRSRSPEASTARARRRPLSGMARWSAAALAACLLSACRGGGPPPLAMTSGPTEQQAKDLEQQLAARPNDRTLQLRLGNLQVERAHPEAALALLREASVGRETAGAASLLLARISEAPALAPEALPAAQQAVAAAPGDPRSWEGLVRILYRMGRRGPAEAALQEAVRRFPNVQRFRFMQAEALTEEGATQQAVATYRAALAKQPEPGPQLMLAVLLARLQRTRDAREAFEKAVALDPSSVAAYLGLARVYQDLGQLDQAEKAAYTALQVAPEDPEAAYVLARVLRARGDGRTARELLDRVLEQRPQHVDALYERGLVALDAGEARDAVSYLGEVIQRQPERTEARQAYARALRAAGDARGAAEQTRLAGEAAELDQRRNQLTARLSENPRDPDRWCDLADFYRQHGIRERALDAYGRAARLAPRHRRAAEGLASLKSAP